MALEKIPNRIPEVGREDNLVAGALPDELESHMGKVFRYALRRGLLVMLILRPFFTVLLLLYTYEITDHAQVDIPLMPRIMRVFFPFKLRLAISGNEIELSLRVFWRWMERIFGRFLSSPASALSRLGPLGILQEVLSGQRVVRLDLKGAPKRQLSLLVAILALIPLLLTLLGWCLFALLPFFALKPRHLTWIAIRSVSVTIRTALRPVPALLAILMVMFATGDAWRMFGVMTAPRLTIFVAVIIVLSLVALYLAMRAPDASWRAVIGQAGGREELLRGWAASTPAKELARMGVTPVLPVADLEPTGVGRDSGNELPLVAGNIRFIYSAIAIVHVFATAFWLSLTFAAVGFIVVSRKLTKDILGSPPSVLLHLNLFGQEFVLTRQLVLLSVTLGCIAALTYAAGTLQSAEGRAAFIEYATLDLRRGIGALAYYVGVLMALLLTLRNMGTLNELGDAIKEVMAKLLEMLERLRNAEAEAEAKPAEAK